MRIDLTRIEKTVAKLRRKDPAIFSAIVRKIRQISLYDEHAISHLKNLRHDLADYKRVHVGSFILVFRVGGDTIIFERFAHHDDAYKR